MATKTIDFPIDNWSAPTFSRRGTPRAKASVRAKVVHAHGAGRRLEVFVTGPVLDRLGWRPGAKVAASFSPGHLGLALRIAPAHVGLSLLSAPRTKTARIAISGAPLTPGLCARVRDVTYQMHGAELFALLPREWCAATGLNPEFPKRTKVPPLGPVEKAEAA